MVLNMLGAFGIGYLLGISTIVMYSVCAIKGMDRLDEELTQDELSDEHEYLKQRLKEVESKMSGNKEVNLEGVKGTKE